MVKRPLVWWEGVAALVTALALVLLVGFTWEASQSALLPPPAAHTHHRPPLRGHPGLYPPPAPLLDLPAISLVANTPACDTSPFLLVLLVISHPAHAALRDAHRTYVSWETLNALGARRVFILADGSKGLQVDYPTVPVARVLQESGLHRDLVVADFKDHYRNLTYKHALALSWATHFCPHARYLLKMDDDIMVDVWGVVKLLQAGLVVDHWGQVHPGDSGHRRLEPEGIWVAGLVQRGLQPQRGSGKWRVTKAEYPRHIYPNYLAGWAYLATQPAATAIMRAASNATPFWIDDVYMTGTVAVAAGVPRYALNKHYTLMRGAATCCLEGPHQPLGKPHPWPSPAPLCGLLVAPSDKNVTILKAWLTTARACHEGRGCPSPPPNSCPPTRPHYGVGTVIALS
ncbi:beta-1,3-galactosyltransferase 4-like [Homarus americanus]|uniref:Hexosyltransferase n=1 Tax=Homarus americanus TaxID=6706 RepID=A0A8J5KDW6_HOMAM|nr:beta-1,3-galactosyltransferase 4-like [Homarus americanus]KAG7169660.1 Beta-1-3-galactosyltransferase 4-like [Homarus americanus]